MRALIEASANATDGAPDGPGRVHHRVIADHLRATAFLIADGVLPSNEGRGYVLRRIMRRAMRHAHLLGAEDPVMWRLVPALVAQMGAAFPELTRAEPLIEETLRSEEGRFQVTLDRGLRLLDDELARLPDGAALPGRRRLPPLRHLRLPARPDPGRAARARPRRRRGRLRRRDGRAEGQGPRRLGRLRRGRRRGGLVRPRRAARPDRVPRLRHRDRRGPGARARCRRPPVETAEVGIEVQVVLNQTPFYAESGGQVGDTGSLRTDRARVAITDVRKKAGLFVHLGRVEEGTLVRGAAAELAVDHDRRTAIRANHSATHLLHEALRRALGDHVAQRGSLVAPDRLRFDFAHPKAMTPERARGRRGRGQRLRPAEHPRRDPDHDPGRRRDARRPRALRREVRRRGPRRRDGRPPRQRPRPGRRDLLARALRRHPRPAHRRHRRLQARLRGRDLERRPPRRGADRRRRARPRRSRGGGPRRSGGAAARPPRRSCPSASAPSSTSVAPRQTRSPSCAAAWRSPAARPRRRGRRPSPASRSWPSRSPASPARTCAA